MKLGLNKMSKKRQKTTNKKTAQNTQKKSDTKLEVKPTDSKMKSVKRQPKRIREARFDKLDNTANLFPVIASRKSSNVYRIAATLTEEIQPEKLQQALDMVLPYFDVMHVRMKTGVFWYYFEDNPNPAPRVMQEYPLPLNLFLLLQLVPCVLDESPSFFVYIYRIFSHFHP